jgi:pyruvate kinase
MRASGVALKENVALPGGRIIITAGVPLGTPAATNMIRIADVAAPGSAGPAVSVSTVTEAETV